MGREGGWASRAVRAVENEDVQGLRAMLGSEEGGAIINTPVCYNADTKCLCFGNHMWRAGGQLDVQAGDTLLDIAIRNNKAGAVACLVCGGAKVTSATHELASKHLADTQPGTFAVIEALFKQAGSDGDDTSSTRSRPSQGAECAEHTARPKRGRGAAERNEGGEGSEEEVGGPREGGDGRAPRSEGSLGGEEHNQLLSELHEELEREKRRSLELTARLLHLLDSDSAKQAVSEEQLEQFLEELDEMQEQAEQKGWDEVDTELGRPEPWYSSWLSLQHAAWVGVALALVGAVAVVIRRRRR